MGSDLPKDLNDREAFRTRLEDIYPEHASAILAQLGHEDQYVSYWHNPLSTEKRDSVSGIDRPLPSKPIPDSPLLCGLDRERITHSEAAQSGAIYIQNPSSYLAAQCLNVEPEMEVLDLAAAPGGKTIALGVLMENKGRIAAVEPIARRFHRLRANVARCGVSIVDFYQRDGRGVGRAVPERFDRVLLDAPCSSEARMRWHQPNSYRHWQLRKVKETQRKQKALIMSGFQALKPGGQMIYCTCSFGPEENEAVVEHLLKRTSAELLSLEDVTLPSSAHPGLSGWGGRSFKGALDKTVRILPDSLWSGFFIARVCKPFPSGMCPKISS